MSATEEWAVWCPDYGQTEEDARVIAAYDPMSAAQDWAEWYDRRSADYSIIGGSHVEVCVRKVPGTYVRTYVVSGETVPQYYATEKR